MVYIKVKDAMEVRSGYARDKDKVKAIKRVRELTGWGLKESKEFVENGFLWKASGVKLIGETKEELKERLIELTREFYEIGSLLQSDVFDED